MTEKELRMTSVKANQWRVLGVVGAVFVPSLVVAALSLPHTFKAGDPIKADEVNANFEALRARLDTLAGGPRTRAVVGTLTLPGTLASAPIRSFAQSLETPVIPGAGTGSGSGKTVVSDVQVVRDVGTGSPSLALLLNQQKHVSGADIVLGNLSVHLDDVLITSVSVGGVQAGYAQETITLSYSSVKWTWQEGTEPAKEVGFDRTKGPTSGAGSLPTAFAYFAPGVAAVPEYVPITGYTQDMACAPAPCKPAHSSVVVQGLVGASAIDILGVATTGKHTATVGITWYTSATSASHSLTLDDVLVSSFNLSTNDDGTLSESAGFAYSRISWKAGNAQTGWDVTKGTSL